MENKPIGIIIPWFGKELKGGAEQQARQVALRLLTRQFKVEVLTTCCKSFYDDWGTNHHPAGTFPEDGLIIRRFKVNRRDRQKFDRLNETLLSIPPDNLKPGVNPVSEDEARAFFDESINSDDLLTHLRERHDRYRYFIFMPYLYGPIVNGLPLVADQAFLQPCLHDEVYAYLPGIERIFRMARGIFYNSVGEAKLAGHLFGPGIIPKGTVVGEGVEIAEHIADTPADCPLNLHRKKFILCAGKRDPGKNTDFIVNCYRTFGKRTPSTGMQLVLIGPGDRSYHAPDEGVMDLGLVSESEKKALFNACVLLAVPSVNESFSRVMMEAWFCRKPVAVHAQCMATAIPVNACGGGFVAGTENEWIALFEKVAALPATTLHEMGTAGAAYAATYSDWDQVMQRYAAAFRPPAASSAISPVCACSGPGAIHQLLPNLTYGDAISNHAIALCDYLREKGYASTIFVEHLDERVADHATVYSKGVLNDNDGLIYHHSIGSALTSVAIRHPGPKCLIYHNITPGDFFRPYNPDHAKLLYEGRKQLKALAPHFPLSGGVSRYNCLELEKTGFADCRVMPIMIDPEFWNHSPDPGLMQTLQDGRHHIVSVGRMAPNKRQDQMIEIFAHYIEMVPDARLFLIGAYDSCDPYYRHVSRLISDYNLQDNVHITGMVDTFQLNAYYRTANLYWSMSEHEGFGVPLIEAMWFDIPVLAYKSSAIAETLGEAAFMMTEKTDFQAIAALSKIMIQNRELRTRILSAQQKRRTDFLPAAVRPSIDRLIETLMMTPA